MKTKYLTYGVISAMIVVALSSIIVITALAAPQANAPGHVYFYKLYYSFLDQLLMFALVLQKILILLLIL
jgi:hypothetical protein